MPPTDWQALRRAATRKSPEAAADLVLSNFRFRGPSIDVDRILEGLGVGVQYVPSSAWSGAVNSNEQGAVVWVRSTDARVRQRFTLAHECGHLLLHDFGVAYRDDTFSGNPREAEANAFAASLLMPKAEVLRAFSDVRSADKLAKAFGVSLSAMQIRLSVLTGQPSEAF